METYNRGNQPSRERLVEMMFRLADPTHSGTPMTIASYDQLFREELRSLLRLQSGVLHARELVPALGRGLRHIYGETYGVVPALEATLWARPSNDVLTDDQLETALAHERAYRSFVDTYVAHEQEISEALRRLPQSPDAWREFIAQQTMMYFGRVTLETLTDEGIDFGEFLALAVNGWGKLVQKMPIAHVFTELKYQQHRNPERGIQPNDVEDLSWVSAAIVYCDVIVMENHWAHLIRQAKLDTKYEVVVLNDLANLPDALSAE